MPEHASANVMPFGPEAPARTLLSRADSLNILQFGPDLAVRGGISAVERLILEHLPARVAVRHVPTMREGGLWRRGVVFARAVVELHRALDAPEPLVVHIHFASRGSTLRKFVLARMTVRAGRPLILHAHGGGFDRFFRRLPPFLRAPLIDVFQRANQFVVLSSQWRNYYIRELELAPAQVTVLPNPTHLPSEVPDRRGRQRVQFLYLGRISRTKGAFDLLRAFAGLDPSLRARSQLVMAGDGELAAAARIAQPLGASVLILPWVDTQRRDRLLAQSDVFVLPSYREGIPMALLEAMANGLPSIVTAVGGIPDVVSNGVEGLFVEPGAIAELSASMAALIRDPARRAELGRRARERARQYDVENYVANLVRVYQRIAPVTQSRA